LTPFAIEFSITEQWRWDLIKMENPELKDLALDGYTKQENENYRFE